MDNRFRTNKKYNSKEIRSLVGLQGSTVAFYSCQRTSIRGGAAAESGMNTRSGLELVLQNPSIKDPVACPANCIYSMIAQFTSQIPYSGKLSREKTFANW